MEEVMGRKMERAERFLIFNSLNSIPVILIGRNTIIDLINETSVAGTVDDVDGYMNITMKNVVFTDQRLRQHAFDLFHVQARKIRVLHIPQSIKIGPELTRFLERFSGRNTRKKPAQKQSFKVKRAEMRQRATLLELAAAEEQKRLKAAPNNPP